MSPVLFPQLFELYGGVCSFLVLFFFPHHLKKPSPGHPKQAAASRALFTKACLSTPSSRRLWNKSCLHASVATWLVQHMPGIISEWMTDWLTNHSCLIFLYSFVKGALHTAWQITSSSRGGAVHLLDLQAIEPLGVRYMVGDQSQKWKASEVPGTQGYCCGMLLNAC